VSKFKSFGATTWVEQVGDQFFWVRDDQRSQDFNSFQEAAHAMKDHKIRWRKLKVEELCNG